MSDLVGSLMLDTKRNPPGPMFSTTTFVFPNCTFFPFNSATVINASSGYWRSILKYFLFSFIGTDSISEFDFPANNFRMFSSETGLLNKYP